MSAIIRFEHVQKAFGAKRVFDDVCLDVVRGETLTIIGASGSGKSVLLKCVIGLLCPDAGQIFVDDVDVARLDERHFRDVRKKVAMVFQSSALFDSLTVAENIAYPLREQLPELTEAQLETRVAQNLAKVNLPGLQKMKPSDLSGGMRKRVGLARAIALEPEVILFDEPTTGLDPISTRVIDDLIVSLKGSTQIVVTHDMDSAFRISDRIAMLADRRIVATGSVAQMRASSQPAVREFFDARED